VPVVAVSPFIGDAPVQRPGCSPDGGTWLPPQLGWDVCPYGDIVDVFVQDVRDPVPVPGAVRADTLMKTPEIARELSLLILSLIREARARPRSTTTANR